MKRRARLHGSLHTTVEKIWIVHNLNAVVDVAYQTHATLHARPDFCVQSADFWCIFVLLKENMFTHRAWVNFLESLTDVTGIFIQSAVCKNSTASSIVFFFFPPQSCKWELLVRSPYSQCLGSSGFTVKALHNSTWRVMILRNKELVLKLRKTFFFFFSFLKIWSTFVATKEVKSYKMHLEACKHIHGGFSTPAGQTCVDKVVALQMATSFFPLSLLSSLFRKVLEYSSVLVSPHRFSFILKMNCLRKTCA